MISFGGFSQQPWPHAIVVGCLLLITYGLYSVFRKIFLSEGGVRGSWKDLSIRERTCALPLIAALIFFGLYPKPFLDLIYPAVVGLMVSVP
jgi:NADH-quinone oxidoreductase subunit M